MNESSQDSADRSGTLLLVDLAIVAQKPCAFWKVWAMNLKANGKRTAVAHITSGAGLRLLRLRLLAD